MDLFTIKALSFLEKIVGTEIFKSVIGNIKERITLPEYSKYKNCFNPPFINAFRSTLNVFADKKFSPYPISDELYDKLHKLDDTELIAIFQSTTSISIPYKSNNLDMIVVEKLKNYNKINNFDLEDVFYVYWQDIFQKEYDKCFRLYFTNNNQFYKNVMVDFLGIALENFEKVITNEDVINNSISSAEKNLSTQIQDLSTKMDKLTPFNPLLMITDNNVSEDNELRKIQTLIDDDKYNECITYIELNIDDNWRNKPDVFKAKICNKLGNCYQSLMKIQNAKEEYLKSHNLDSSYDSPIYNLAQIFFEEENYEEYKKYLELFNDKTSFLYKRSVFLKLIYVDKDLNLATSYLENNLKHETEYLFLKALMILQDSMIETSENAFKYLEEYISKNPQNKTIALYNLLINKFTNLLNQSGLYFSFNIKLDGTLNVSYSVVNEDYKGKFEKILKDLEQLFIDLKSNYKYHIDLITSIEIKIYLVKYSLEQIRVDEIDIVKINTILNTYKLDRSTILEAITLNIICGQFDEAYKLYLQLNSETKELCKNNFIIILFGEKKYEELLDFLMENANEICDINKQFELIAIYKTRDWEYTHNFMKTNKNNYSNILLLLCVWLYHEKLCYDEELELLMKLANNIISNPSKFKNLVVFKTITGLHFFASDEKINVLISNLIEIYWNSNKGGNNFNIGLMYAKDLYNKGKYSDCLSVLNILRQYEENNSDVETLYAYIDAANYNTNTIIENYEKGILENTNLSLVAHAYIDKNEFDEAEKIIESLKYTDKLKYYYLKIELFKAKKVEIDIILNHLEEAIESFPEDVQLNQVLFNFLLKPHTTTEKTHNLFKHASSILEKHNLLFPLKIDIEHPFESLKKALETFQPYENYKEREKTMELAIDNYNNFRIPISLVAQILNTTPAILMANFLGNEAQSISLTKCSNEEYASNMELLNHHKTIIMGTQSLILLKALEIDDIVFKNFKIKISQIAKQEISYILSEEISQTIEKLIKDKNGNPKIIVVENKISKYNDYLKYCSIKLETVNYKSNSANALSLIKAAETINSNFLYDCIVSLQNNFLVCTSDEVLHILSKEFKYNDISIITIIDYLAAKNIITNKKVAQIKYKLIEMNCKFIPLDANTLYYNTEPNFSKIIKILEYLDDNFEKESIIIVLSDYIYKLSLDKNYSNSGIYKAIDLVFDKCQSLDNYSKFVKIFMIYLMPCYVKFDNYSQKYLAQHFWMRVSDKSYIKSYYQHLIVVIYKSITLKGETDYKEIERIVFNAPKELHETLKNFIVSLIKNNN